MMIGDENIKPGYWWAMIRWKCPRCRRGDMFKHPNPYKGGGVRLKNVIRVYDHCPVCGQKFDLEPGFWLGTAYMSYALLVGFSGVSFLIWWLLIGFSLDDDRLTYWLIFNSVLCLSLLPLFMRFSRWLYLNIFVQYDKHWMTGNVMRKNAGAL